MAIRDETWRAKAECLGMDVSIFISAKIKPRGRRADLLRDVCDRCPVMVECRVYAVRLHQSDPEQAIGWWGGMNEEDRLEWAIKEGLM